MEITIIETFLKSHGLYGLVIALLIWDRSRLQKDKDEQGKTITTIARNSTVAMMAVADMLRSQRERELEARVDGEWREAQARAERKLGEGPWQG